jgi:hypothetical protein
MIFSHNKLGVSYMKKTLVVGILFLALISVAPALAIVEKPQHWYMNPFDKIWDALLDLQGQISNIEITPGPQGPAGPQGPIGQQGLQGIQGSEGAAGTCDENSTSYQAMTSRIAVLEELLGVTCTEFRANCNGLSGDGCEIHLDDDRTNCGACEIACSETENCILGLCTAQ